MRLSGRKVARRARVRVKRADGASVFLCPQKRGRDALFFWEPPANARVFVRERDACVFICVHVPSSTSMSMSMSMSTSHKVTHVFRFVEREVKRHEHAHHRAVAVIIRT